MASSVQTSPLIDPAEIRRQLDRLLSSGHIRHSKRCQALLSYVVDAYLEGSLDKVKERTIGVEVFHREPDYDTNDDSVVRTTALEVRKRLAQYYADAGHEQEIRVLLEPGSYIPEFRMPVVPTAAVAPVQPAPLPATAPTVETPPASVEKKSKPAWFWVAIALLTVAELAAPAIWYASTHFGGSDLDLFWKPLVDDRASAMVVIEQPSRIYRFEGPRFDELNQKMVGTPGSPAATDSERDNMQIRLSELKSAGDRYYTVGDFVAAVRIAEWLGRRGKSFEMRGDRATSYNDLRGHPTVLMGAFSNKWTSGLTAALRYQLVKNADKRLYEVHDNQADGESKAGGRPDGTGRIIASTSAEETRADEYAIISRIFDASTEKMVIAVSGMTFRGTSAGGDFLTNAEYMHAAFQDAPKNWYRKNCQLVLKTTLVGGTAGPPKVVAAHFW